MASGIDTTLIQCIRRASAILGHYTCMVEQQLAYTRLMDCISELGGIFATITTKRGDKYNEKQQQK